MWPSCAARSRICSLDIILAEICLLSQNSGPREGRSDALVAFSERANSANGRAGGPNIQRANLLSVSNCIQHRDVMESTIRSRVERGSIHSNRHLSLYPAASSTAPMSCLLLSSFLALTFLKMLPPVQMAVGTTVKSDIRPNINVAVPHPCA